MAHWLNCILLSLFPVAARRLTNRVWRAVSFWIHRRPILHSGFVCIYSRESYYYVRVSSPGWWFVGRTGQVFFSGALENWLVLPAVNGMKHPWVVRTDKQMSNQVSMKDCNHTSSQLNIIWKSGSHLVRIVGLFPIGLWTEGKNYT